MRPGRSLQKPWQRAAARGGLVLAVGIVFMALGAVRGAVTTVWRKAATVGLECIGLG